MKRNCVAGLVVVCASSASAAIIINDNFDSYPDQAAFQAAWTTIGATSATLSTAQSHSALNAIMMLTATNGTGGNRRNLGGNYTPSDADPVSLSYWMYYEPGGTRHFNEIRDYAGAGYEDGALQQLYAAGWNNAVTAPGEVFDGTKFQARVAFGTAAVAGYYNLNLPGVPNRSTGWHKFTMEIRSSDVNVYVDDILGRTIPRGTITDLDSVVIGSRLTSANIGSWTDDLVVSGVPEPTALVLLAAGGLALIRRR